MKRYVQTPALCAVAMAIAGLSRAAAAQPPRPFPHPPGDVVRPANPSVAVKSVAVNTSIRDGVAETTVAHVFENRSNTPQEADFLFPIPDGASVSSFALYDGDTKMDARLLDKAEATRTYEEIVRRRRDPALLTFEGRAALRARVFPIAPHSTRRITLKLVTVLPREGDAKKYVWTLAGPHLPGAARPENVSVKVTIAGQNGVGNVYSPTHPVVVQRERDGKVTAVWESGSNSAALTENPEFDLFVSPGKDKNSVALSVLTYNAALPQVASLGGGAQQSGYFLVVASPTIADAARAALPRRVVLVLDRSGSMQGKKIEQARGALRFAVGKLRPQDSFNLITFSDKVEKFAPEIVSASPDNLKRAQVFVDNIVADGGTNINGALQEGLAQFVERSSNNTLLFFTDGLPTVGVRDHDTIIRNAVGENAKKARTFVFGVGYDVDVPFLDNVGRSLRGDADYVRPDEDIEVKTSQFVAKTSAAVLENLRIAVDGANAGEIYPKRDDLPDLFAGSQLVLVGRYTGGNQNVKITLTGEANGKPQSYALAARFPAVDTDSAFLPRLWASRKIGYLMDEVRLRSEADVKKEMVDQIITLSKEFGVLTPYTAMFVPEPGETQTANVLNLPQATTPLDAAGRPRIYDSTRRMGLPSPAAAPRQGEAAVNSSQAARGQRGSAQVGNVYAYSQVVGQDKAKAEQQARQIQNVASRTFYQVGAVWTDATYDAKKQKQVVKVKLYSPAYFALTRRNRDLAKWAALGSQVIVAANATQAVQFGDAGKESLTEAEITALAGKPSK